jgi:hypothetical protein
MQMSPKLRAGLLIAALAITLGAVQWAGNLPGDEADGPLVSAAREPRPARRGEAAPAANDGGLDLQRLQRGPRVDPDGDPFDARSFRRAPPPERRRPIAREVAALEAPPAPAPRAPPLPFVYMGKLAEGPQTTVFLVSGDRNLVVKLGDVIDNTYKVEEVSETAVVLTYLPLNVPQTLGLGAR